MRPSTLIFGQPHTKDCVMKLSGGMAQIPLHAKFSTCPSKHSDFKMTLTVETLLLRKHSYIRSIFAYTNPFTFPINTSQQHLGLREHRFGEQQHIKMAFQSGNKNIRQ